MTLASLSVSVVICAYTEQRWDDLIAAVGSIQRQCRPASEIIVVIDHNPALLQRTQTRFPDIAVIENLEQRGLSGARNSAISVATGDIIAFMDEDAEADPDWIEQLLTHYSDAQVRAVGGAILPQWQAGRPAWFPTEFDWVVGCTYTGMPTTRAQVRNLIGCNMSFRRDVFDAIGGFTDGIGRVGAIPLGCEETELCIRLGQHWSEARVYYEPQARVRHHVPAARGTWSYFRSRCYSEGVSKAQIARLVGAKDSLSTEQTYTLRTLPLGVMRGLADTIRGREPGGVQRACVIIAGLVVTAAGYAHSRLSQRLNRSTSKIHLSAS